MSATTWKFSTGRPSTCSSRGGQWGGGHREAARSHRAPHPPLAPPRLTPGPNRPTLHPYAPLLGMHTCRRCKPATQNTRLFGIGQGRIGHGDDVVAAQLAQVGAQTRVLDAHVGLRSGRRGGLCGTAVLQVCHARLICCGFPAHSHKTNTTWVLCSLLPRALGEQHTAAAPGHLQHTGGVQC
jgi:hypothetical protein